MEEIKIKQFLCSGSGYGSGSGSGYGSGSGSGSSYGSGSGYGYGSSSSSSSGYGYGSSYGYGSGSSYGSSSSSSSSSGYGYGSSYGSGYGYGSGSGSGYGSSYGSGSGSGSGYDDGISKVGELNIYKVDDVNTVFYSIHKNVAKGAIFNKNFTFTPCYIVKGNGYYAHGETIEKAMQSLESKIFQDLDVEERVEKFVEEFELNKKYPAIKFYDWHNRLTGSCEMGRKAFARDRYIDLDEDEFTVEEFIKMTENSYGGSIIQQLKEELGL